MELPREIFNEVLFHLRRDWARHPTALSNSGLQIALTCKWLHEDLATEIKMRKRRLVGRAIETDAPRAQPTTRTRQVELNGENWSTITAVTAIYKEGPLSIRNISLNLPLLRSEDTDLIWSIASLVSGLPNRSTALRLELCLDLIQSLVDRDMENRGKWARALLSALNAVTARNDVSVYFEFKNFSGDADPAASSQPISANGYGDFDAPSRNKNNGDSTGEPLLSLPDFKLSGTASTQVGKGPSHIVLRGPVLTPALYPFTQHIIRRSPNLWSLCIQECRATDEFWSSVISTWDLPSLSSLTLDTVNIPLLNLLSFLNHFPLLEDLSFIRSCDLRVAQYQAAEPTSSRIRKLTGDLPFLTALFSAKIELKNLKALAIDCHSDPTFDRTRPESWSALTGFLAQLGRSRSSVGREAPFTLSLLLPLSPSMTEWLGTTVRQEGQIQKATKALKSFLGASGRASSQGSTIKGHLAEEPQHLLKCIQNLHFVTSLDLRTSMVPDHDAVFPNVDPKSIIAFLAAFPALKDASVSTLFTNLNRGHVSQGWSSGYLRALGHLWEVSDTLERLEVKDIGTYACSSTVLKRKRTS